VASISCRFKEYGVGEEKEVIKRRVTINFNSSNLFIMAI
jgi:hypothetical protein